MNVGHPQKDFRAGDQNLDPGGSFLNYIGVSLLILGLLLKFGLGKDNECRTPPERFQSRGLKFRPGGQFRQL